MPTTPAGKFPISQTLRPVPLRVREENVLSFPTGVCYAWIDLSVPHLMHVQDMGFIPLWRLMSRCGHRRMQDLNPSEPDRSPWRMSYFGLSGTIGFVQASNIARFQDQVRS